MLAYVLLLLLVFENGFIQICFGIFEFFALSFLLNFTGYFFPENTIFFIDEKNTQWTVDTKAKVFHESISCFMRWPRNCISWNALKKKFQSVSFPWQISPCKEAAARECSVKKTFLKISQNSQDNSSAWVSF